MFVSFICCALFVISNGYVSVKNSPSTFDDAENICSSNKFTHSATIRSNEDLEWAIPLCHRAMQERDEDDGDDVLGCWIGLKFDGTTWTWTGRYDISYGFDGTTPNGQQPPWLAGQEVPNGETCVMLVVTDEQTGYWTYKPCDTNAIPFCNLKEHLFSSDCSVCKNNNNKKSNCADSATKCTEYNANWEQDQDYPELLREPVYFTNGVLVALTGTVKWNPPNGELMGTLDDGLILEIADPDCPYFDQVFSVTNVYGTDSVVKVSRYKEPTDDGKNCSVTLESWSIPSVYVNTDDDDNSWYVQNVERLSESPGGPAYTNDLFRHINDGESNNNNLNSAAFVTFDGIVWVSVNSQLGNKVDEHFFSSDCTNSPTQCTKYNANWEQDDDIWPLLREPVYYTNGFLVALTGTVKWNPPNGELMGTLDDGLILEIADPDCPYFNQTFSVTNDYGTDSVVRVSLYDEPTDDDKNCGVILESWSIPIVYVDTVDDRNRWYVQNVESLSQSEGGPADTKDLFRHINDGEKNGKTLNSAAFVTFDGIVWVSARGNSELRNDERGNNGRKQNNKKNNKNNNKKKNNKKKNNKRGKNNGRGNNGRGGNNRRGNNGRKNNKKKNNKRARGKNNGRGNNGRGRNNRRGNNGRGPNANANEQAANMEWTKPQQVLKVNEYDDSFYVMMFCTMLACAIIAFFGGMGIKWMVIMVNAKYSKVETK